MMGISAKNEYKICQIDVITVFSYGFLDEKIYIIQPIILGDGTTHVCLLKKAFYDPKQSPRV